MQLRESLMEGGDTPDGRSGNAKADYAEIYNRKAKFHNGKGGEITFNLCFGSWY